MSACNGHLVMSACNGHLVMSACKRSQRYSSLGRTRYAGCVILACCPRLATVLLSVKKFAQALLSYGGIFAVTLCQTPTFTVTVPKFVYSIKISDHASRVMREAADDEFICARRQISTRAVARTRAADFGFISGRVTHRKIPSFSPGGCARDRSKFKVS